MHVCMYVSVYACAHVCLCMYTGTGLHVGLDLKEYKRIWIPSMDKRRAVGQEGEGREAYNNGGGCIWAEHMLCFKVTSFVSHWTLTTCSEMDTESQRVDCKQSQLGGDNPEIWLRLWGSGPGSQDKLCSVKCHRRRSRAGQALKSMQRSVEICSGMRRGDACGCLKENKTKNFWMPRWHHLWF